MTREKPRLSAKKWSETPDGGFVPTAVKLPEDVSFFEPKKEGVYRLEIVPYTVPKTGDAGPNPNAQPGELHYERTYFTHRGIGVDERTYVCPAKTAGKPCPICEHRKELMRDKDGDEDLIKDLAPKQRQLWNVFDHADADKGVQIWDVSFHLFGKQLKKEVRNADEDDGFEYFADPEDGFTLRVGLEEKSFGGNSFLEAATVGFKKRKEPLSEEIMNDAQPLDSLLLVMDYDKLKAIFLQEEGEVEGDSDGGEKDEDDDKPPKQKERPKKEEKKDDLTAQEAGISKGDDVKYEGTTWMVTKISEDGTVLTLMDEDDNIKKGVLVGEVRKAGAKKEETKPADPTSAKRAAETSERALVTSPSKEKKPAKDDDDDWDEGEKPVKKETKKEKEPAAKEAKEEKKSSKENENWDDDWA